MIEPVLAGPALCAEVRAASPAPGEVTVWRLGQAGVVCVFPGGPTVVVDAYLSNHCEAVLSTPFDHRRLTRAPLDGSELGFADVIVCTHAHLDHLDVPTLRSAARLTPRPTVVAPRDCREALTELGWPGDALALTDDGETLDVGGLTVSAVAVPHDDYDATPAGGHPYQAYVLSDGNVTVAHLGDSRDDGRVRAALGGRRIDLAFLPINGRDDERARMGFAGNMTATEAVDLAVATGIGTVVPIHYDMFAQNVDPGAVSRFASEATRRALPHRILGVGQACTIRAAEDESQVG